MGWFSSLFGLGAKEAKEVHQDRLQIGATTNTTDYSTDVYPGGGIGNPIWDGEKFPGGYGGSGDTYIDYETIRVRSNEVFEKNLYGRGLVRRRNDNIIGTGLQLEATPDATILGMSDDERRRWTENVERQWEIWAYAPWLCDAQGRRTLAKIQREIELESTIDGDVLITLRWDKVYKVPQVDFIRGSLVMTPFNKAPHTDNRIVQGIELDAQNRQVAFWVYQSDGGFKRLPAWGEKSKRRLAWIYSGNDKRADNTRATPRLALMMQGLKEVDTFSAAVQRKAVVNSHVAGAIERNVDAQSITQNFTLGGSAPKGPNKVEMTTASATKAFARLQQNVPGIIIDRLQPGEKLVPFNTNGALEDFEKFLSSHMKPMAWANGMSPEVLFMEFNKSFSAAQAANNEQKLAIMNERDNFGIEVLAPIYEEWLYASALSGKVQAQGLIDSAFDTSRYDEYVAWIGCEWAGQVKPVVDIGKVANAYALMVDRGWMTNEQVARELGGRKFDDVITRLKVENEQILEANAPLAVLGLISGSGLGKAPAAAPVPAQGQPTGHAARQRVAAQTAVDDAEDERNEAYEQHLAN